MWIFYPIGSAYDQRNHVLFEDLTRFEELTGCQLKRSPSLSPDRPLDHVIVFDGSRRIGDAYKRTPIC